MNEIPGINLSKNSLFCAFCTEHKKEIVALVTLVAGVIIASFINAQEGLLNLEHKWSEIGGYAALGMGGLAILDIIYLAIRLRQFSLSNLKTEPSKQASDPSETPNSLTSPRLQPPPKEIMESLLIRPLPVPQLPPAPPHIEPSPLPSLQPLPPKILNSLPVPHLPAPKLSPTPPTVLGPPCQPPTQTILLTIPSVPQLPKVALAETPIAPPISRINLNVEEEFDEQAFFKNVIKPFIEGLKECMLEWLDAAYLSYHKGVSSEELLERRAAMTTIFETDLKMLALKLITDAKSLLLEEKAFLSIFLPGFNAADYENLSEKSAPQFTNGLLCFLRRFIEVLNEETPFKKRKNSCKEAQTILDEVAPRLDDYKFGPILFAIENAPESKLSKQKKQQALVYFKALQYPFYYAFTDSWWGMKQFRAQFKECAIRNAQNLITKLEYAEHLKFNTVIAYFQQACKAFQKDLRLIRTKGK